MPHLRAYIPTLALLLASLACNTVFPPHPALTWDTSPSAVIIEVSEGGGMVPMEYMLNSLHPVLVWGDGHMVWVENQTGGGRRVLEVYLTPQELTAILQKISGAGFFGWASFYEPRYQIYDAGSTSLSVNLTSQNHRVSEYAGEGAPQKYHDLLAYLVGGAGTSGGTEFVPTTGYLTALSAQPATGQAPYHWPDASLGYPLDRAISGLYLEGEALAFAWRAVNENYFTVIESGGMDYHIALQIPGLSQQEPPEQ